MKIYTFIEKPATVSQRKYLLTHPWMKHLQYARIRAKRKGWECTLTAKEAEELWEVCDADRLTRPSIDRIDPKKGYTWGNCRFIELIENIRLGNLGRVSTEKQREASKKNINSWAASQKGKSIEQYLETL